MAAWAVNKVNTMTLQSVSPPPASVQLVGSPQEVRSISACVSKMVSKEKHKHRADKHLNMMCESIDNDCPIDQATSRGYSLLGNLYRGTGYWSPRSQGMLHPR